MDSTDRTLMIFVTLGALAGLSYHAWNEIIYAKWLVGRWALAGSVATGGFFWALLAIAPRVAIPRAAGYAALHGAVLALLMVMTSWRYAELGEMWRAFHLGLPLTVLLLLPLPFWIAHAFGDWRDYDVLFEQAYQIALRFILALMLIAVVWVLIFLFDQLLALVGLAFMDWLLRNPLANYLITGAAGGLGIAVTSTSLGEVGVRVALAMLRPLLVPVLVGVALFLVALPFRGLSGLGSVIGKASAGETTLAMAGLAAALITAVADIQARTTPPGRILALSARLMAGLIPLLAAVAMVALGQRIQQYGWTPDRLIGVCASVVAMAYGLLYAAAAPRADWMARLRRANVALALATIAVAALVLTPLLNPERIATASQMAGYHEGSKTVEQVDVQALDRWGVAGDTALAQLRAEATEIQREGIEQRQLDGAVHFSPPPPRSTESLRKSLQATLPVQPTSAMAATTELLQNWESSVLEDIHAGCARTTLGVSPACVMVVADFLPGRPGDEVLITFPNRWDELEFYAFRQTEPGGTWTPFELRPSPDAIKGQAAANILRAWQAAPPQLTQAPVLQMQMSQGAVMFLP